MSYRFFHLPIREQQLFSDPNEYHDYLNNEGRLLRSAQLRWLFDICDEKDGYCPVPQDDAE